ncbi:MAG: AsmA family protein [Methylococcales bacterium]|jgi:AsmA protein|nr:AsmA family protein [Methylococcales bacterium]
MKKILKFLFLTISALILLVVGAVLFLDPNDFKGQITEQFEKATGRTMTITGNLGRTLWPNIGFSIQGVSVGNAEGYTNDAFAEVEELSLGLAIIPLFSKQLEVKAIKLSGVTINAEKNKAGKGNWENFGQGKTAEHTPDTPSEATNTDSKDKIPDLSLDGVTLERVNLKYTDHRAGQTYAIRDMSAKIGAFSFGKPFDFQLALTADNQEPEATVKLTLSGVITADPNAQKFAIADMKFTLNASGKAVGPKPLSVAIASDISADLKAQLASLKALRITLGELEFTGAIEAKQFITNPQVNVSLASNTFNLKETLAALGQAPIKTQLETALTQISTAINLTYSGNNLTVSKLELKLDETSITGKAKVANLNNPAIHFDLNVTDINVDHYLPPHDPKAATTKTPEAQPKMANPSHSGSAELPLDALKALNIDGKIAINKVVVSKLILSDIRTTVTAKNGKVTFHESIGSVYQGSHSLDVTIDARRKPAKFSVKEQITNVEIGELLVDLGNPDIIDGTSNIVADVTASGNTVDAIKRSLNGKVGFAFAEGSLKWLDVTGSLGATPEISAFVLKELGIDPSTATGSTDFTELKGNGILRNGIMTMNDLSLTSPKLGLKGTGTVNIPAETLDYKLAIQQVKVVTLSNGRKDYKPKGRSINLSLTGPLANPNKNVDLVAMLKDKEVKKITKKLDKKLDKLGVPKEAADKLKNFLSF